MGLSFSLCFFTRSSVCRYFYFLQIVCFHLQISWNIFCLQSLYRIRIYKISRQKFQKVSSYYSWKLLATYKFRAFIPPIFMKSKMITEGHRLVFLPMLYITHIFSTMSTPNLHFFFLSISSLWWIVKSTSTFMFLFRTNDTKVHSLWNTNIELSIGLSLVA